MILRHFQLPDRPRLSRRASHFEESVRCRLPRFGIKIKMLNGLMRERYWTARSYMTLTTQLFRPSNRSFAHHVARDYLRFLSKAVVPIRVKRRSGRMPQKDGSCGPKISRMMTECHSAISRAIQTRQTAGAPHIRKRPAILFHHCLSFHRASAIPRFGNMPGASSMIRDGELCKWPHGRQRFSCRPGRCKPGWFAVQKIKNRQFSTPVWCFKVVPRLTAPPGPISS